ncbi:MULTISPECIES: energy transducer TonB [Halomonadaceae]|uniref:energy transducer TonB n=1 Tax=Halomonadaceae TaxID=28256 RepID=UPI00159900C4|nr:MULTISPECIES: energy transducer TonB [Halomonas]QJQ95556.1 energy transducer TonB [Halomonas sp. PA5]
MASSLGDPIRYAPVTRSHRRLLAWALALLLHLALIGLFAGWTLVPELADPVRERRSLDVVLVGQAASEPVEAEAIAEASQHSLGEQAREPGEVLAPSFPQPAPARASLPSSLPQPSHPPLPDLVTAEQAREAMPATRVALALADVGLALPRLDSRPLDAEASETTSVHRAVQHAAAVPDDRRQQAAREAAEARYVEAWTRRIEEYGNHDYPVPARLQGEVRIRVVIGHDGELRQAEVVQSSHHPEIDRVAMATVQGAAPYPRFDRGMEALDSLSITRVWRFGNGNDFGVQ